MKEALCGLPSHPCQQSTLAFRRLFSDAGFLGRPVDDLWARRRGPPRWKRSLWGWLSCCTDRLKLREGLPWKRACAWEHRDRLNISNRIFAVLSMEVLQSDIQFLGSWNTRRVRVCVCVCVCVDSVLKTAVSCRSFNSICSYAPLSQGSQKSKMITWISEWIQIKLNK